MIIEVSEAFNGENRTKRTGVMSQISTQEGIRKSLKKIVEVMVE